MVVQEVGVTPNLNIMHSMQDTRTGLDVGSPKLGLKVADGPTNGAKWPITINFGNILPRNTVSEQYSNQPLFMVLELGELEYHFF